MACIRRGHNPLVVRLMKALVNERVVEVAMDPVDAEVGKEQEDRELSDCVPQSWTLIDGIVKLAVATNFKGH